MENKKGLPKKPQAFYYLADKVAITSLRFAPLIAQHRC